MAGLSTSGRSLPKMRTLRSAVGLGLLATAALGVLVLWTLGGWSYYHVPLRVRAYDVHSAVLKPSGSAGHLLGIVGLALMLLMQTYTVRKKLRTATWLGPIPAWLDFHVFCGIFGPAMVVFHTAMRFNGIVSVALWSMVAVTLSGFIGRYLYIRVPRSLRGQELSFDELQERATVLRERMITTTLPLELVREVEAFERAVVPPSEEATTYADLLFGELRARLRLRTLRKLIRQAGVRKDILHEAVALAISRAVLLRRMAYLEKTKRMFALWHVFHRPLAVVMFLIIAIHVGTAVYMGYDYVHR